MKSVSWRQHQQHIDENQQATPNQATHADDQSDGVRLERIHESPTPLPNPRGEDGTPEQGETSVLATYSDHIHIPENPLSVVARRLIESTTLVAFLAAVSLPFLYLPLLLFGGFDSTRFTAVLLLLGLHAISLAIGYQYEPTKPFGSD